MKKKIFALLCFVSLCLPAAKYPPGLRWREIEGRGFTVIFPAGRASEALAALEAAETLNGDLASFWRFRLPGRTRIVLSDSTDDANGFATFYPFNLIGTDLAEPPPDSELAGSRSLLDLVLAHEMTHLFTMNAGAPPFRLARRLFGSHPVFYPAVQLPPWVVEGLAVEGESRLTGDGRLNHAPYRLMLDAARREGLFPGWERLAGLPTAWPGPNGKYLFGAGFMEFLAGKYGSNALRRYLESASGRLLTFGSSRDFEKTFGTPLGELWREYRGRLPAARGPAPEPLPGGGFFQQYPCPMGQDELIYYRRDYRRRGEVVLLDLKSGKGRPLFRMDAVNGLSLAEKGNKIYLSAVEHFHAFSEFSDLYEYDVTKGRLERLSRGGRLSCPVRQDGSELIYCIQRRNGRFRLALFGMKKKQARSISMGFAGLAQLSLSPGGGRIAAAAKPAGGPWGIAVFLASGALDRFLTVAGTDLSQPRWQGNDKLLFIVSGKETSSLASYSLDGNGAWRLDDPFLSGLRQFDLSRDGREVFFTYVSGRGQEIARRPTAWTPLSPMDISVAAEIPEVSSAAAPAPPRSQPYRFWRDLLPRWWSPAVRQAGDEVQAGIMTSGQDALGIHSYSLEGYYGVDSYRANFLFQYVYDGLFPTLSLSVGDSVEYYRGSDTAGRTRELTLASLWPLRIRKRSQLHAYADLHCEKRSYIQEGGALAYPGSTSGFRLGLAFNSSREYYDSISPADGMRLALQGSVHPAGMGNEWASRNIQADLRGYVPLLRPGVLAWRLAAARSWNAGNHFYDMGGLTAAGGLGNSRPFRLLRGFGSGYFLGDRGWQFNAEYRLPLFRIERALLPAVSFDRVWLNAFLDAGRLWSELFPERTAYSLGGEAVLRLAFGGLAAYDFAFGFAHGFGPEKKYWIYLRTGRSF